MVERTPSGTAPIKSTVNRGSSTPPSSPPGYIRAAANHGKSRSNTQAACTEGRRAPQQIAVFRAIPPQRPRRPIQAAPQPQAPGNAAGSISPAPRRRHISKPWNLRYASAQPMHSPRAGQAGTDRKGAERARTKPGKAITRDHRADSRQPAQPRAYSAASRPKGNNKKTGSSQNPGRGYCPARAASTGAAPGLLVTTTRNDNAAKR